jgi:hypothetical protein
MIFTCGDSSIVFSKSIPERSERNRTKRDCSFEVQLLNSSGQDNKMKILFEKDFTIKDILKSNAIHGLVFQSEKKHLPSDISRHQDGR